MRAETKQRFAAAAARQGLSESALLQSLIEQMLSSAPTDSLVEPSCVFHAIVNRVSTDGEHGSTGT